MPCQNKNKKKRTLQIGKWHGHLLQMEGGAGVVRETNRYGGHCDCELETHMRERNVQNFVSRTCNRERYLIHPKNSVDLGLPDHTRKLGPSDLGLCQSTAYR